MSVRHVDACAINSTGSEECISCICIHPGDTIMCTSTCEATRGSKRNRQFDRILWGKEIQLEESGSRSFDEVIAYFIALIYSNFLTQEVETGTKSLNEKVLVLKALKSLCGRSRTTPRPISSRNTTSSTPNPIVEVSTIKTVTTEDLDDEDFRCEPEQPFKVDCNTCWCDADGKEPRLCTRIACNPKVYPS